MDHCVRPVFDTACKILILGTFPSVKSREAKFFYHHPQNRFWRVLAAVLQDNLPETVDDKKAMLLRHHIALWDVIASCDISGSSDSSIKNVVANDLSPILSGALIGQIYTNGATAHKLYQKHLKETVGLEDVPLPSTSAANASFSLDRLVEAWQIIRQTL